MNNMLTLADVLTFIDSCAPVTKSRIKQHIARTVPEDHGGREPLVGDAVICRVPAYMAHSQKYVRGVVRYRHAFGNLPSVDIRVDLPGGTYEVLRVPTDHCIVV